MNSFDLAIETYLSNVHLGYFATRSIERITDLYTFKGLVLIPVLWWMWFQQDERSEWRREMVLATLLSGLVALFVGRLLTHWLPFRVRPIYSAELHLRFAGNNIKDALLTNWSSFPSDHAMLWMAVATGIFLVWRSIGVLAILYTVLVICVPRAYLGFHYPTDLLVGAAVGIGITYVMTREAIRVRYARPALRWIDRYPGPSGMLAFLLCLELVTQFDELRTLASSVFKNL
ncbi:phosphatase PAP2 family protein [Paraburkholderia phytofirmans]|uniref:Phosphoesterase PA-phosphatase related n=1 Tax=Paraburkholderia phytofirmans (strain DSM 17436 / LMG 22146 / PsJN) TaxID=398527 RepID=B2TAP4_PARPJ|nr:phosphatase PAP2 family protein [Paraburkholderia phytofirmans]ACD20394.1 phosphoesterase PA-phosphatase related [Paraburkholderia phytofirmans PsJN]